MKETTFNNLSNQQKIVLEHAEVVMANSYSPYSNFMVGASILTEDNNIITGTNIENASYGATICAEQSAISQAISIGFSNFHIIAIIAKQIDKNSNEIVSPCGICRQIISEFSNISKIDTEIIMSNSDKTKILISSIKKLLPISFKLG